MWSDVVEPTPEQARENLIKLMAEGQQYLERNCPGMSTKDAAAAFLRDTEKRIDWTTASDAGKCIAVAQASGWQYPRLPKGSMGSLTLWPTPSGWPQWIPPDYLRDPSAWWPLWWELRQLHGEDAARIGSQCKIESDLIACVCIAYLRAKGWEVVT